MNDNDLYHPDAEQDEASAAKSRRAKKRWWHRDKGYEVTDKDSLRDALIRDFLKERRREQNSRRVFRGLMLILLGAPALMLALLRFDLIPNTATNYLARVNIIGTIGSEAGVEAEPVIKALKKAFESNRAKAVLVYIDSPGGAPSTAQRIWDEITRLKAEHDKPVEMVIEGTGASAAYLIATAGDRITANRYAVVGSIGAVMSSWNIGNVLDKADVEHYAFTSGRLKDMLSPYRNPTDEEIHKADNLVEEVGEMFYRTVVERRGDHLNVDKAALTTGEVWTAHTALAMGLVDELGTVESIAAEYDDAKVIAVGPLKSPMDQLLHRSSSWLRSLMPSSAELTGSLQMRGPGMLSH